MSQLIYWGEVRDKHTAIVEFIDWRAKHGIHLDSGATTLERILSPTELADRFLEVNRSQLERERRELLSQARQQHEQKERTSDEMVEASGPIWSAEVGQASRAALEKHIKILLMGVGDKLVVTAGDLVPLVRNRELPANASVTDVVTAIRELEQEILGLRNKGSAAP